MKTPTKSGLLFIFLFVTDTAIIIPLSLLANYYSISLLFGCILIYLMIAAIVLNFKILKLCQENTLFSSLSAFLLSLLLLITSCFYSTDFPRYTIYQENEKLGMEHWPTGIKYTEAIYDSISEEIQVTSSATYMYDTYEGRGHIQYSSKPVFQTKISGKTGIRSIREEILPPIYDSLLIRSLPVKNPYNHTEISCDFLITYLRGKCDTLSFGNCPYPISIPYQKYDTTPVDL